MRATLESPSSIPRTEDDTFFSGENRVNVVSAFLPSLNVEHSIGVEGLLWQTDEEVEID